MRQKLVSLSLVDLKEGINFICDSDILVYCQNDTVRACKNICKHQKGKFSNQSTQECIVTCSMHGWELDLSQMRYSNPIGNILQEELEVEIIDESVSIYEHKKKQPWGEKSDKLNTEKGDFIIRYLCHACVEVRMGKESIYTDPWLVGPAFSRGWWLLHEPPKNWLEQLSNATAIFISHNHSDHLNEHTLRLLAQSNPDIPVYVPSFDSNSCSELLDKVGMKTVIRQPFDTWIPCGNDGRLMILRDGTGRDDSGILFEYKGYRVLNTVDCANLNGGHLPEDIDVLLTSFAGGASGFPVCWQELFSDQLIASKLVKVKSSILNSISQAITTTKPKFYMPFAGYFIEAHPDDDEIKKLNIKNSPDYIKQYIQGHFEDVNVCLPQPDFMIDVAQGALYPSSQKNIFKVAYEFDYYLDQIREARHLLSENLQDLLTHYYRWCGFSGDLILHVIETDDQFIEVVSEHYIDFSSGQVFLDKPNFCKKRYLRMKVRTDVYRYVIMNSLPWEEISIGFQARFYREPDVYNFDFWDHFQNNLPSEPFYPQS